VALPLPCLGVEEEEEVLCAASCLARRLGKRGIARPARLGRAAACPPVFVGWLRRERELCVGCLGCLPCLLMNRASIIITPIPCLASPNMHAPHFIVVLLFSQHANSKPTHTHTQRDGFWGPLPGVCLAPTARGQLRASISWGGVGGGTQTTFGRPPHVVHGGNYCTSRPCSVQRYVRMVRRRRGCGMTRRAGRSCPRCEARRDGERRGRGLGVGVACKSRERIKCAASP